MSESISNPDLLLDTVLQELEKRLNPGVDMNRVYIGLVVKGNDKFIGSGYHKLVNINNVREILTVARKKILESTQNHQILDNMCILEIIEPYPIENRINISKINPI